MGRDEKTFNSFFQTQEETVPGGGQCNIPEMQNLSKKNNKDQPSSVPNPQALDTVLRGWLGIGREW
jgi:hypothetical protein